MRGFKEYILCASKRKGEGRPKCIHYSYIVNKFRLGRNTIDKNVIGQHCSSNERGQVH